MDEGDIICLLGRTNRYCLDKEKELIIVFPIIDKKETGLRLRILMDSQGVSVKMLQEYLGLGSVQSIYYWLNGESMPTVDNLYAMSKFFDVPIDELVRGNYENRELKERPKKAEAHIAFSIGDFVISQKGRAA